MRLFCLVLICGLGACAPFPQIDTDVDPNATSPALVPLDSILGQARANMSDTPAATITTQSRMAALQARAARLRGSVIDRATLARMQRGVLR